VSIKIFQILFYAITKCPLVLRFNDWLHPSVSNVVATCSALRSVNWITKRSKKPNTSMFKFFRVLFSLIFVPTLVSSLPSVLPRKKPSLPPSKHRTTRARNSSTLRPVSWEALFVAKILRGLVLAWLFTRFTKSFYSSSTQLSKLHDLYFPMLFDAFLSMTYAYVLRI